MIIKTYNIIPSELRTSNDKTFRLVEVEVTSTETNLASPFKHVEDKCLRRESKKKCKYI